VVLPEKRVTCWNRNIDAEMVIVKMNFGGHAVGVYRLANAIIPVKGSVI